ncbi:VanZ family protein [Spirochaeta lutea]|uniref:VanZ-like domain-containing protein n=1 Tax=Spirochaeta lutea TaxID=1480694 RepID=A0A098QTP8_9SPIO|nr:VanZ family protein [Spirochaeta lutea]KGE70773.1 hypothetical protein DC28_14855 [Spirochaeta lutea]
MKSKTIITISRILLGLSLILVFVLSVIQLPDTSLTAGRDKLFHGLAYTALGALAVLSVFRKRHPIQTVLLSALLCAVYGGFLELIQQSVGRTSDIIDALVNSFGALLGSLIGLGLHALLTHRTSVNE